MRPVRPYKIDAKWLRENYCRCGHHLMAHVGPCFARLANGRQCRCMEFTEGKKESQP